MDAWRAVVQRRMAVHTHPIDLVREEGVRGDAQWIGVLYRSERRVFDSRAASIELKSERGARWIIARVRTAIESNVFAPLGAPVTHRAPIVWSGSGDECTCEHGSFAARVSLFGLRASVGVHRRTADAPAVYELRDTLDIAPRTSQAARFLAELAIDLASAGHAIPTIA